MEDLQISGNAGKVNWTIMKQIKEKVKIPVIANGDVTSYTDGLTLLPKNRMRPGHGRKMRTTLPLDIQSKTSRYQTTDPPFHRVVRTV